MDLTRGQSKTHVTTGVEAGRDGRKLGLTRAREEDEWDDGIDDERTG